MTKTKIARRTPHFNKLLFVAAGLIAAIPTMASSAKAQSIQLADTLYVQAEPTLIYQVPRVIIPRDPEPEPIPDIELDPDCTPLFCKEPVWNLERPVLEEQPVIREQVIEPQRIPQYQVQPIRHF